MQFRSTCALTLAGLAVAAAALAAPFSTGARITVKKPVDIAQLNAAPEKFVGKTVRLEGTVKAVCQGRGCWVEVADATGKTFLAKSLDESVLLPKDCAGRAIVVQGVVTRLDAPSEEGAEAAEKAEPREAKGELAETPALPEGHDGHAMHMAKAEPGVPAHECPAPTYVVSTQGARLK